MRFLVLLAVIPFCFCVPAVRKIDYTGHSVLRIVPKTEDDLKVLSELHDSNHGELDFWLRPGKVGMPVDIRVGPVTKSELVALLEKHDIDSKVIVEDVQKAIELEQDGANVWADSIVGTYPRHAAINTWLDNLAAVNAHASVEKLGKTTEGRDMKMIKISTGGNKKIFWMDSGIHAREWITISTAIYMIDQLVNHKDEAANKALLDKFDFYILPVANPDGYEFTTTDRMWRKTRRRTGGSLWRTCYGADPNRNWDHEWGKASTSRDPCSDIYPGEAPWSEPEVRNMRDTVNKYKSKMAAYIAIHSYSQLWLTPWGYTSTPPSDNTEMMRVANAGADAVKAVNSRSFTVGSPARILYAASGGAYDWVKAKAGVKYSYTLELFPKQWDLKYWNGFVLPTSEIMPAAKETYAGIKAVVNAIP